jgi:hypothetical protein
MSAIVNPCVSAMRLDDVTTDELIAVSGGCDNTKIPQGGNRLLWDNATKTGVIFLEGNIYFQTKSGFCGRQ